MLTQLVEVNSKKNSWTLKNLSSNPCSISNGLCHIMLCISNNACVTKKSTLSENLLCHFFAHVRLALTNFTMLVILMKLLI
jgi:hypothetical protein